MKNFTFKTINGRTGIVFLFFLVVITGLSVFIYSSNNKIKKNYHNLQYHSNEIRNISLVQNGVGSIIAVIHEARNPKRRRTLDDFNAEIKSYTTRANETAAHYDTLGLTGFQPKMDSVLLSIQGFSRAGNTIINTLNEHPELTPAQIDSLYDKVYDSDLSPAAGIYWNSLWGMENRFNEPYRKKTTNELTWLTNAVLIAIVAISSILLVVIVLAWWYFRKALNASIALPKQMLEELALGKLPDTQPVSADELGSITKAANILALNMKNASNFALSIGKGQFDFDFQPLSEDDVMGHALLSMRDELKSYTEGDKKRNYLNEGLAKFAVLMRNTKKDLAGICSDVISELVKYTKTNQGGIFLTEGDTDATTFLNLAAAYAYDRKKYLEKRIQPGEGLVGQCFLEQESIYLTVLPDNYVNISSGLGKARPKCLFIVPIKSDQMVTGVLEIASFHPLADFEKDFIEKICENFASVISSLRLNEKTKILLEQSQQQAEEMRAQEEEMRQNMEELEATQEEMRRSEQKYIDEISLLRSEV